MRGWVQNLALSVAALLVFGACSEALTRAVELRPRDTSALANPPWLGERWLMAHEDYRERFAREGLLGRYFELYQWDRLLSYRLRPDRNLELLDVMAPAAARPRTRWSVHTNSRGYREREFSARPEPGVRRIVALGDSSTFGWGVEAHEAYPARLRTALGREPGWSAEATEVLNLGVPGYSTLQGRIQLELEALPLAPDVVLWSYLANDGQPTGLSDREALESRLGWRGAALELLHRSRAFETLEAWVVTLRRRLAPVKPPSALDPEARNVRNASEAVENIRSAVAVARDAEVPLVLVANCVRGRSQLLARVAQEAGVPFLDATALLDAEAALVASSPEHAGLRKRLRARYGAGSLREQPHLHTFLPDECHPNAYGHRRIAEELAGVIAALPTEREPS